ncbi:ABC transporter substrate-binding protein [Methylobacterium nodulans]|uniref:Extracellular ligand-binding receptor n=1 Tax=Methylobacterium nodulans (strain LMG 21967 / CNCM I-2342 / ORS 2060) TaxID=460265 RepID=B8IC57_METNO|nr:Extracellular ligand-binding receptor [Methylobacterium nodulans ORS 2060]
MKRKAVLILALAGTLLPGLASAQDKSIRIGVLNDQSGPYADFQGIGSVIAAQMAVEDYGGTVAGRKIDVVSADHQNKTDVGANIARAWIDRDGVDLIVDVPNSAVALAVSNIAREKNKVLIGSGAGSAELTGRQCSPNTVHWTYDTWSLGHSIAHAVVQRGGKNWFFLTADYAFGHDLERQASEQVQKDGGTVLGTARHPVGTPDFSSFLLRAQSSGAQVLGLANAGADETTAIKQAVEFGLTQQMSLVGLVFDLNNVPALGMQTAQGILTVNAWYWDLSDPSREFAKRFAARHPKRDMPNHHQAGVYAGVLHYLKAVDKAGSAENGKAVVSAMKALPTDDPLFGKGSVRQDGRAIHPMYLLQVKTPEQSKSTWDVFNVLTTIPGEDAFRPLEAGGCPLVQK